MSVVAPIPVPTPEQAVEEGTATKKTPIMKPSFIQKWRGEAGVQVSSEALDKLDEVLLSLDWTRIIGFTLPDVTETFAPTKKVVHDRARDTFQVKSVPLRTRLEQNLAWIAGEVLKGAAEIIKGTERNRIMPKHVEMAWGMVSAVMQNYTWAGIDAPKKRPAAGKAPARSKKAKTEEVGGPTESTDEEVAETAIE